jgi:hypothetical protein
MPAEILSLDLDWFNTAERETLKDEIYDFFATLKTKCKLPRFIDYVPEHQYLYPWSVKILDGLPYRKMNVVNIDEHHDFYSLDEIDFDDPKATVGCWNFFGHMAHKKLMGKYTWVTNGSSASHRNGYGSRSDLLSDIRKAKSAHVKKFKQNVAVVNASKVFDAVHGKKFDGFMIIRSPVYTDTYRSVYHAVDEALASELPRTKVRRYKCRVNFKNNRVRHQANNLFWKV